jgi:chromosome partitioning protein
MYRLLLFNSKGGAGKTLSTANAGVELARLGKRVLLVGADPQPNLELTFGVGDGERYARDTFVYLEDLFAGRDPHDAVLDVPVDAAPPVGRLRRKGTPKPASGSLSLLPTSRALKTKTAALAGGKYRQLHDVLTRLDDEYDVALIDTQGADSQISLLGTTAADGIVFVGEPGAFELTEIIEQIRLLRERPNGRGDQVAILGVLFTRTDPRSSDLAAHVANYRDPDQFDPPLHVFGAPIRQQVGLRSHAFAGWPTAVLEPYSHLAQDYRAFAKELAPLLEQGVPRGTPTATQAAA